VAALVLVLMVPIHVGVLVSMHHRLVAVLVPVMSVGTRLMAVLVLMLVLAVATHLGLTSFFALTLLNYKKYSSHRQGRRSSALDEFIFQKMTTHTKLRP